MSPKDKWLDLTAAINLLALCGMMALFMVAFAQSGVLPGEAIGSAVAFPLALAFAIGCTVAVYDLLFVFVFGKNAWDRIPALILLFPVAGFCAGIVLLFLNPNDNTVLLLLGAGWYPVFGVVVAAILWMLAVACFHKSRPAIVLNISALALMFGNVGLGLLTVMSWGRGGGHAGLEFALMVAATLPLFLASLPYAAHAFGNDCPASRNGKWFHLTVAANLLAVGVLTALSMVSPDYAGNASGQMRWDVKVGSFVLSGAMVACGIFYLLRHSKCPWERVPLLALLYPFLFFLLVVGFKAGEYNTSLSVGCILCGHVVAAVVVLWMLALACVRKSRSAIWASIAALVLMLGVNVVLYQYAMQFRSLSVMEHMKYFHLMEYLTLARALPPLVASFPYFVLAFLKVKIRNSCLRTDEN